MSAVCSFIAPGSPRRRFAVHASGLLTALVVAVPAAATEAPRFVEHACELPTASAEVAARLRCGTVRVPRDPAQPQAGHVDLAVVVKRGAAPQPGADPVLILHGGPGGEQVRYMGQSAQDLAPGRDSIAFDMRGGGRTGPTLCQGTQAALLAAQRTALAGQDAQPARAQALKTCWDELEGAGFRPEHFGTERNVGDAEAVRQALGIARWSVYGMSYGTAVAAEYLRRHPQAIASVVLDSLYPPDAFVPPVREAQGRAIARLLDECAADAACARRFPGLQRAEVDAVLQGLTEQPLAFHLAGQRYVADEGAVRTTLHGLLYREDTARAVPWFLDAVRRRDGDAIAAALGLPLLAGDLLARNSGSIAGLLATDCRDRPRHHAVEAAGGPSWTAMFSGVQHGVCARWALGTPPSLPQGTSVPVLVLSAGYDGFQPDGAAVAAAIGPAATAVTVPRAAHVVRGAGPCPRSLIARFIAQPAQPLDTTCLASMEAPPFVLDVAPRPQLVATAMRAQAGKPAVGMLLALAGALVWLGAGVIVPVVRGFRQRWRGAVTTPGHRWSGMVVLVGALGLGGLVAGLVANVLVHPGAAAFGIHAGLAPLLWLPALAGAMAVPLAGLAARRRAWLALAGALGVVAIAAGACAAGAVPGI